MAAPGAIPPAGYAVPPVPAPARRRLPALLMLASLGLMALSLFLPLTGRGTQRISVIGVLAARRGTLNPRAEPILWLLCSLPPLVLALGLLLSALAFFRRNGGLAALTLLIGLLMCGFNSLLVSMSSPAGVGVGVWLSVAGSAMLVGSSLAYRDYFN